MRGSTLCVIGFVLGVRVDAKTIDTIGFPVIILAAMTIIPFDTLGASGEIYGLGWQATTGSQAIIIQSWSKDLTEKQNVIDANVI